MKMTSNIFLTLFLILGCFLFPARSLGQTYQKHPRAMELERQMTKDALDFLKSRFPDYPVIVTVAVDPIYRVDPNAKNKKASGSGADENLPFFRAEDDEILDEWDDPSLPNSVLLTRVKKIVVNVSVPGHLTDDEVAEIKQSLTLNLNLLPARDTIEILRRTWGQKKENEFNPMTYIWTFLGGLFLFFVCLLIAIWTPMRQIARILKEGVAATKNNGAAGGQSVIVPMGGKGNDGGGSGPTAPLPNNNQGDVRFSDPIKLQTAISLFFTGLSKSENFPSLEDMIFLDNYCKSNPSLVGAFMLEAPSTLREKIFSYSSGQHWLEAMYNPGAVDIYVYELLHKLNRANRSPKQSALDYMTLVVWRLDEQLGSFLKGLPQADAFSILHRLPKSISLKVARKVWPGGWATLLEIDYQPKELTPENIIDITNSALKMLPLRTLGSVLQFKQDMDLMEFLGTVDPMSEREIYMAAPPESFLHKLRPPFFKIFEAPEKILKTLVESVSLMELAMALSNVPAKERKKVEAALGPKQRIRFSEYLKQYEASPENIKMVGSNRLQIAELLNDITEKENAAAKNQVKATENPEGASDDDSSSTAA